MYSYNQKLFFVFIFIVAFLISGCQSQNNTTSNNTDWFHKDKWGIMASYLADPLAASGGGKGKDFVLDSENWNIQVDSFDVKGLADQLEDIGVKYYLITLGQNSGHYCSPNATYDKIVGITPSKCSRRDLIVDLYKELEPRGIKLIVYLPSGAPAADPVAAGKLKWRWGYSQQWPGGGERTGERLAEFQQNWEAIIREWSLRWGKHVAGWWIDGCYFANEMYRFSEPPNFASFAAALKAGNPDAIIAFNPGVKNPIAAHTEHEDYTAGEISQEIPICHDRWVEYNGKEIQYHLMSYLGKGWSVGDRPRYSTDELIEYTRRVTDGGGVITWDVPFDKHGLIAPEFVQPLKRLSKALEERN
ncbi:MAG: alpha-L-fucosidase [Planctomycetota bacterium]|nr:alpha-L-fucosidase [Planctomycetota bacterium]